MGVTSGVIWEVICLGHHLAHVSGCLRSVVLNASLMSLFILFCHGFLSSFLNDVSQVDIKIVT